MITDTNLVIRKYTAGDEKGWVYCKALSYLFSPFFDDMETCKSTINKEIHDYRIEYVAEISGQIVGLLDIDIYNREYSQKYLYAPCDRVAYFTNLAVHPDYQNLGIAQKLYAVALEQLKEQDVEKLAIFTRKGDVSNHLYKKWGGNLVCKSYLVVGTPKEPVHFSFSVDLDNKKINLKNRVGETLTYYLREGIYIVSETEGLELFDIERCMIEYTYIIDLT